MCILICTYICLLPSVYLSACLSVGLFVYSLQPNTSLCSCLYLTSHSQVESEQVFRYKRINGNQNKPSSADFGACNINNSKVYTHTHTQNPPPHTHTRQSSIKIRTKFSQLDQVDVSMLYMYIQYQLYCSYHFEFPPLPSANISDKSSEIIRYIL